jgi:hypothetical protein
LLSGGRWALLDVPVNGGMALSLGSDAGQPTLQDAKAGCRVLAQPREHSMGRLHLFELEDYSWFPRVLRDAATAYLRRAVELTGIAARFVPLVAEAVRATRAERIVDLCSGGGGPVVELARRLREAGVDVPFVLTDLFPNVPAFEEARRSVGGSLEFESASIDASRVPDRLDGMRTLFNAFHHFRQEQARAILADAVARRQPIGVFEVASRDPLTVLAIACSPLLVVVAMPTIRPIRLSWLFFTYVVPLVPALVFWDGIVSCLRVYSPEELRALVDSLPPNDFAWDIGRLPLGPMEGTFLVGCPRQHS